MRKRKFNPQAFRVQASSSGRFVEITPEIALFICDEFEELMSTLDAKQADIERLEKGLRHAALALDQAAYVFERDKEYGPDSGQAQAVRSAERSALETLGEDR